MAEVVVGALKLLALVGVAVCVIAVVVGAMVDTRWGRRVVRAVVDVAVALLPF